MNARCTRSGRLLVLAILVLLVLACSTGAPAAPTTAPGEQETRVALGVIQTQNASMSQALTAGPQAPAPTQASAPPAAPTPDTAATEAAPKAAQEAAAQATANAAQPTSPPPTEPPAAPSTATPVDPSATQAQVMADYIAQLYSSQRVRTDKGKYYAFENLDRTWFDPKTISFTVDKTMPDTITNFVMRARVAWRAPGNLEKPERTGCGFVYGYSGMDYHHTTFLGLDSKVHTLRSRGNENIEMKGGAYTGGLGDEARLMLIVENKVMHFFVNDLEVVTFRDPYFGTGKVGLATLTGSPQGFTCKYSGAEVWVLEE